MTRTKSNQYDMRDPRTEHVHPPFPHQPQETPGLAGEMAPPPDHGEETYVGLGRLTGRKALVTGGDSGIGRAAAIAFAREGAEVVINHLAEETEDAETMQRLLADEGRRIHLMPGDVQDEGVCRQLAESAATTMGGLDILVNNAGWQISQASIFDIPTEQFDRTFRTNVYAMFWLSKAALPRMPAGATVINVTSILGFKPADNLLDYSATKAAIIGFTKSLAKQMAPEGKRVNAVAPGPIWTPIQPSEGQPQEKVQHFAEGAPFGRPGQPVEVAPTFVFLASQESGFMTGEVIGVTGGNPT